MEGNSSEQKYEALSVERQDSNTKVSQSRADEKALIILMNEIEK